MEYNYPRVTTIISETDPPEKKRALMRWQKKMEKLYGIEGAVIEKQKILDNGTGLHKAIEDYLTDSANPLRHKHLSAIKPLLNTFKRSEYPLRVEQRLFCHKYQFQGQPDLVASYEGLPAVIDWTTSQNLKIAKYVEHKFLQAGAYAIALEEIGVKTGLLVVVVVCSNFTIQVFKEHPEQWRIEFLKRLGQYKRLMKEKK